MRGTLRNSRGSTDHNDRSKGSSTENVIYPDKTKDNAVQAIVYDDATKSIKWQAMPQGVGATRDAELAYYERAYGATLEARNAGYIKKGHPKSVKTMEEYYHSHPPVETILQIGKAGETVDAETTKKAVYQWINEEQKKHKNMHIISFAVHVDESIPHAHVRYVLDVPTEQGRDVREKAACEAMGYKQKEPFNKEKWIKDHPDIDFTTDKGKKLLKGAKEYHDRFDNAKMAFTDVVRRDFYNILLQMGIQIETETDPNNRSRRNKLTQEYKMEQLAMENARLSKANTELADVNDSLKRSNATLKNTNEILSDTNKILKEENTAYKELSDKMEIGIKNKLTEASKHDPNLMWNIILKNGLKDALEEAELSKIVTAAEKAENEAVKPNHDNYEPV